MWGVTEYFVLYFFKMQAHLDTLHKKMVMEKRKNKADTNHFIIWD